MQGVALAPGGGRPVARWSLPEGSGLVRVGNEGMILWVFKR